MRSILSVVVIFFLTCSFSAVADSFENEVGLGYSGIHGSAYSIQGYVLTATRFLSPVDTDSGPLGEAAFLARIPALSMNLAYVSTDGDNYSGQATQWRYGFEAAFVSKQTPVTAWLGAHRINNKSTSLDPGVNSDYEGSSGPPGAYRQTANANIFQGGVGAYLTDRSHLGVEYTRFKPDASNEVAAHAWGLSGKHLAIISDTQSLGIGADVQRKVDDTAFSLTSQTLTAALEYFFTRSTSVGVRIKKSTNDDAWTPLHIYRAASVTTFITPTYRAGISLENVDSGSEPTIGINVGARF